MIVFVAVEAVSHTVIDMSDKLEHRLMLYVFDIHKKEQTCS